MSVGFGVGAALTLDEFSIWLDLERNYAYWSDAGRLNIDAIILFAMASRDIMPFIRTTDVADLSFLPVGKAMGGYTGTISPAAVRRLVDEARKHFDVILICCSATACSRRR